VSSLNGRALETREETDQDFEVALMVLDERIEEEIGKREKREDEDEDEESEVGAGVCAEAVEDCFLAAELVGVDLSTAAVVAGFESAFEVAVGIADEAEAFLGTQDPLFLLTRLLL